MVEQIRDIKDTLFFIGSRISLSVGRLPRAKRIDKYRGHSQLREP